MPSLLPTPLALLSEHEQEPELRDLKVLGECGLPVAEIVVVPAALEEEFYRLNNLNIRLRQMFAAVDMSDPDDDEIEDIAPEAKRLVKGHYLLDEFIDGFYQATSELPSPVRVRRPGESGLVSSPGRPALLALKRSWCADWEFDSLWSRLSGSGSLLPEPRPVLIHAAGLASMPVELNRDAEALLGRAVTLHGDAEAGITSVRDPGVKPGTRPGGSGPDGNE